MNNQKSKVCDKIVVVEGERLLWHVDLDYDRKSSEVKRLTPKNYTTNGLTQYWVDHVIPWVHCRYDLLNIAKEKTKNLNGLILDFGTLTGNCAKILTELFPNDTIYGFDSWKGYPVDFGTHKKGDWAIPIPNDLGDKVKLIVGYFENTLDKFLAEHPENIKILHLDCDVYDSVMCVLDKCIHRLQKGSVIQFNGFFNRERIGGEVFGMMDECIAWEEFIKKYQVKFQYLGSQSVTCTMLIEDFVIGDK